MSLSGVEPLGWAFALAHRDDAAVVVDRLPPGLVFAALAPAYPPSGAGGAMSAGR
jgi:hypothetical protein